MAGEGGGGEADSWVPIPPGGTGTPQTTKKDGKRERAQYSTHYDTWYNTLYCSHTAGGLQYV